MLKCIAIDDEPLALRQLTSYISKIPYLDLVAKYNNALEAQQMLAGKKVDLIFVDINMPDLNGVDFVRALIDRPMVKISDIVYLESEGEYVRMHLADGTTITTLFRLKNMETALPSESFMRVHRSYIVNLRTIKAYVKGRIFLNDTEYVPIGENYKEAFQGYIDKNFRNL